MSGALPQRPPCTRSATIFGVMKTSSSVFVLERDVVLNRFPTTGMLPRTGTWVVSFVSFYW